MVLGAASIASGCGAARRPPRPFPGPAPAAAAPASTAAGEGLAALALALQGAPYANGGSDPTGFDCSGLVHYVFGQAGVPLPRSVRELALAGREVADPRAGDLVFFAIDGATVSHVGIATGPDAFVHAPSSHGVVRVERLSAAYWARRYAFTRRIASLE